MTKLTPFVRSNILGPISYIHSSHGLHIYFHHNLHLCKGYVVQALASPLCSPSFLCPSCKPKTFLWHQYKKVPFVLPKKFKLLFCFWSGFQVRWSLLVRNKHINSQILSFIPFFKSFNPSLKTFLNSFLSCKLLFLDNLVGKLNQS
jgi:hypothetical protein